LTLKVTKKIGKWFYKFNYHLKYQVNIRGTLFLVKEETLFMSNTSLFFNWGGTLIVSVLFLNKDKVHSELC
jgi:hypothetical protein